MSKTKWLGLSFTLLALGACTEATSVQIAVPSENSTADSFRELSYFTPTSAGRDMEIGTQITTFFQDIRHYQNGVETHSRKFDSATGAGMFHRLAYTELALRGNLAVVGQGNQIQEIKGIQSFYQDVIDTLRLGSFLRSDLKRPYYINSLEPELRTHWTITHLLSGTVPFQTKLPQYQAKTVNQIPLDSVWVYGIEEDDLGDCLHYTAWYTMPDTVTGGMLTLQSFKTSPKLKDESKNSKYLGAVAKVKHSVWIDPESGRLCKEDVVRDYTIQLKDTVLNALREFPAQMAQMTVYRATH